MPPRKRASGWPPKPKETPYHWTCGCGTTGTGEKAASSHVKTGCTLFGYPRGWREKHGDPG